MRTILLVAFALTCIGPLDAAAQVRRCVTPEGGEIYTDRQCAALGAVEQPVAPDRAPAALHRGGCTRTLRDLMFEVGAAIDAKDANRLAGLYHWSGMSTREAYSVVERLDAITRRPLIEVAPVMPGESNPLFPQAIASYAPTGLRIEQTLANGTTPSRTVFGLERHFGCWWIRG
jgi:hypothetical protein